MTDSDKKDWNPLHFGNMVYKPEEIKAIPVVGADGKPWRGIVKPRILREAAPEPYRHPFLNTEKDD